MPVAIEYRLRSLCAGCSVVALLELCVGDHALLEDLGAQGIPVLVIDDRLTCALDTTCPHAQAAQLEAFKVVYADTCAGCGCDFANATDRTLFWDEARQQFDWICGVCQDTPQGMLAAARCGNPQPLDCSWCGATATALLFNYHQEQLALCNECLGNQCGQQMLEHHWNVVASMNAAVREAPRQLPGAGSARDSAADCI